MEVGFPLLASVFVPDGNSQQDAVLLLARGGATAAGTEFSKMTSIKNTFIEIANLPADGLNLYRSYREVQKLQDVLPGQASRDHGPHILLLNFDPRQTVADLQESRSSCRTCCWGEQVFFSLSRLLWSTLCPGRLSNRRSRGTEDRRREERDWKTASSHRCQFSAKCLSGQAWHSVGESAVQCLFTAVPGGHWSHSRRSDVTGSRYWYFGGTACCWKAQESEAKRPSDDITEDRWKPKLYGS
ncbi:hypothetical protein EYF80_009795 [Liparis tanakae]|uniref:Uncharacterized protein n=1 Tax=Liparis tanakae TaxID=230148 RepID=A0A4Z2IQN0_9TELE|nr:hypothetical protein EYF80_009795 [Liparis tanakae]